MTRRLFDNHLDLFSTLLRWLAHDQTLVKSESERQIEIFFFLLWVYISSPLLPQFKYSVFSITKNSCNKVIFFRFVVKMELSELHPLKFANSKILVHENKNTMSVIIMYHCYYTGLGKPSKQESHTRLSPKTGL